MRRRIFTTRWLSLRLLLRAFSQNLLHLAEVGFCAALMTFARRDLRRTEYLRPVAWVGHEVGPPVQPFPLGWLNATVDELGVAIGLRLNLAALRLWRRRNQLFLVGFQVFVLGFQICQLGCRFGDLPLRCAGLFPLAGLGVSCVGFFCCLKTIR